MKKFKPQHYEIILLTQWCKLKREEKNDAKEWMGCLRLAACECEYRERDRGLKEQFINDDDMMIEIIREVSQ